MTENTITYYIMPGLPGHGAAQFGNGDIWGKYPFAENNIKNDRDRVVTL